VVIEDDVEIGANAAIDRATTGVTRIGAGTKIDNLVQIGHNCTVGQHCLMAAMTGLGGTVRTGDLVALGGHVGVRDNVRLESGVQVTGYSGIWGDLGSPGLYSGNPARPHRGQLQVQASVQRLPRPRVWWPSSLAGWLGWKVGARTPTWMSEPPFVPRARSASREGLACNHPSKCSV
jgi:UDP-3-O-[3-hydroxymyristoyl] glucosamine N-acyltransferase LpxD